MAETTFNALVVDLVDDAPKAEIKTLPVSALPGEGVLIKVDYSSLNYKDGLAVTGKGKIIRQYPMVPGIDLAGTVVESRDDRFREGEAVVVTGWGLGERHWGGYAQYARVRPEFVLPLPDGMTTRQAMAIGTAGFTAMLCVQALQDQGVKPEDGEVLVTGAAGGVGSIAIALLARLGYTVVASSGRPHLADYLQSLGASRVIDRSTLTGPVKPLASEQWAGAVDTVGGTTLANVLSATRYGGSVAACGLAGGSDLPATVFPFILRGVNLLGVDSVMCPNDRRQRAWAQLKETLPADMLEAMTGEITLGQVMEASEQILRGEVRGRLVVDVNRI